ncbi:hypothetical protein ACFX12_010628 [Malus domestica]
MAEEQKVQIPRVQLGTQGFEVSKLGFGCMGLSGIYNDPVPEDLAYRSSSMHSIRELLSSIHQMFMDLILMKFWLGRH